MQDPGGSERAQAHVLRLHLLGGFRLLEHDSPVTVPQSAARLLAFLAFQPAAAPRAVVAGQLYGHTDEERARASLRAVLWRLRRACPGVVRSDGAAIELDDVWVDVRQVQRELTEHLAAHRAIEPALVEQLRWDLLPGWYDDWLLFERERLRHHCLFGLEAVARQRAAEGDFAAATDAVLSALRLEPLRERGHRLLIEIHLAAGDRIEAARALAAYGRILAGELGVAPSADFTREVTARIQDDRSDTSLRLLTAQAAHPGA